MEDTKELITADDIRSKVYIIRGQQVMLDKDLPVSRWSARSSCIRRSMGAGAGQGGGTG